MHTNMEENTGSRGRRNDVGGGASGNGSAGGGQFAPRLRAASTAASSSFRRASTTHTQCREHTSWMGISRNTGANTVRVVLSGGRSRHDVGERGEQYRQRVQVEQSGLRLEDHDTTGYGEHRVCRDTKPERCRAVLEVRWQRSEGPGRLCDDQPRQRTLRQQHRFTVDAGGRRTHRQMRDAGFRHTLVLTAPNWGQDWQGVMKDNAKSVYGQD